jgi:hypothetical protein
LGVVPTTCPAGSVPIHGRSSAVAKGTKQANAMSFSCARSHIRSTRFVE